MKFPDSRKIYQPSNRAIFSKHPVQYKETACAHWLTCPKDLYIYADNSTSLCYIQTKQIRCDKGSDQLYMCTISKNKYAHILMFSCVYILQIWSAWNMAAERFSPVRRDVRSWSNKVSRNQNVPTTRSDRRSVSCQIGRTDKVICRADSRLE